MFFDSHAHYDDEQFQNDREELLAGLYKAGISYVVNAGSSIESSKASIALADRFDFIYAAVGVHPGDSEGFGDEAIRLLEEMCLHKKVVAIGEIGLDYYYDNTDKPTQQAAFRKQLALAAELSLPVVIHDRDAHRDCLNILKECGVESFGGVMHCYSGSVEMAKTILDMGMYISLGGPVTYKNARHAAEVARYVPMDRLLIETDCPYLTPAPHRGKRNSSAYLCFTAEKIAQIKGTTLSLIASKTKDNAKILFKIK
jgi:TatD DNase family protein